MKTTVTTAAPESFPAITITLTLETAAEAQEVRAQLGRTTGSVLFQAYSELNSILKKRGPNV